MDSVDVVVPDQSGGWKATLRKPQVWIPSAAGVVVVGVVVAMLASTAGADPAASPTPTPTASASGSATPSASPSAEPSATPSPTPTPSATSSAEATEEPAGWTPGFPVPGAPSDGKIVARFGTFDSFAVQPTFSPNGESYVTGKQGMDGNIWYVGSTAGAAPAKLADVSDEYSQLPVWAPNSSRIAYLTTGPDGTALAVAKPNGSGVKVIGALPALAPSHSALGAALSWSADGSKIAVSQSMTYGALSNAKVTIFDVATGSSTTLEGAGGAAFAPSGSALAYYDLDAKDVPRLVVRNSAGTVKKVATIKGESWSWWSRQVQWAPNGSRLAYFGDADTDLNVAWHLVNTDGTDDVKITPALGGPEGKWAPDSRHFAATNPGGIGTDGGSLWLATAAGKAAGEIGYQPTGVAWVDGKTLTYVEGSAIQAYNLATGEYAHGGHIPSTSLGYAVVPGGTTGVLTVLDIHDGTGTVSVHRAP